MLPLSTRHLPLGKLDEARIERVFEHLRRVVDELLRSFAAIESLFDKKRAEVHLPRKLSMREALKPLLEHIQPFRVRSINFAVYDGVFLLQVAPLRRKCVVA